jgi:TRAP-type C4-dicarboxylate transport system permease small subunit
MFKRIDRLVGWGVALCLGAMTCIVCISVVFRYVLNSPLTWSEELASLLFAWLTFVGAYAGFRSRSHISIDTLVIFLPPTVRRGLARFVDVCVLLLLALFIWQGINITATTWSLEYPAMEISRGYLYLAFPIGAALMAIGIIESWQKPSAEAKEEGP